MNVEFRILGPLEIYHSGRSVPIGGFRERTILAVLLLEAGHVVPIERLIDAVWDEDPPATARGQVQICISNLRRRLSTVGRGEIIETRSPGYLLRLSDGELDLHAFESRVEQARAAFAEGEMCRAVTEMRAALALWRGPALAGLESPVVGSYVTRLEERRLAVLGECLDYQLRSGAHHELIGELAELVKQHPLQERFQAQYMTALYRSGRQAEALEVYRNTRERLAEELGIEPGEELRRLHQAILTGELSAPPTPSVADVPTASTHVGSRTPSLLPAAIPDFIGRTDIIDRLRAAVGKVMCANDFPLLWVSTIVGQGGVGKTTLALHLAHLLAPQFPDGQLFARLRDGDQPVSPFNVLERFLRALGVSGPALPKGLEERAEVFRDLVGRRRMLIVLDDAMSEAQVASLLPGNARCAVIVTSRRRLTGLPVASRVELGAFDRTSSIELLSRIVGADRIEAEPAKVQELCALCGDLPLALRIVGARLAARPHWGIADLLDRLVDDSRRLDELRHGEMGVRASILVSYEGLSGPARTLFHRLALLEAPSFSGWVGGPLLEMPVTAAQDVLEELTDAYLLDVEPGAGTGQVRYRFHNLVRPFARERLVHEGPGARRAVLERWLGALLFLAEEAHRREYGGDFLVQRGAASRWRLPHHTVERLLSDPLNWFEDERAAIVAAVRQAAATGFVEHAWELALNAVTLFESRSYLGEWLETHEDALDAACRHGDSLGEAVMRYSLGSLFMFERRHRSAAEQFTQALKICHDLECPYGAALVLRNMAYLDRINGDLDSAVSRWETALAAFQTAGDRVGEAHVLQHLAQVRLDCGDLDAASELLEFATFRCQETSNHRIRAQVTHRLGHLLLRRGDLERAADAYRSVLAAVRAVRDTVGECYALLGLATVDLRRGCFDAASEALDEACSLAAAAGDEMATYRVELTRAELGLESGDLQRAENHAERAITGFDNLGAPLFKASGLLLRGRIRAAVGEVGAALTAWRAAADTLSTLPMGDHTELYGQVQAHMASLAADPRVAPPVS